MRILIIAEIGQNHVGNTDIAKALIYEAKASGADIAKFQLYDSKVLYGKKQQQELSKEQVIELAEYCKQVDIEFMASVFDVKRIQWCEEVGVKRYKIATRSIDDYDLLQAVYSKGKQVIMSLPYGIASNCKLDDVRDRTSYLYCIPEYPTLPQKLHLGNVQFVKGFDGFSDHSIGITAAQIAISRWAQIIEKHFRLESNPMSPDYLHSITPTQMRRLVRFAREAEIMLL